MHLVYLKLELKRAYRSLPALYAGAAILLLLVGMIALLSSRMLYNGRVLGRVSVGVSIPDEDGLAKQVMKMVSSLESVDSVCDFQYMDLEICLEELEKGNLYAVLEIPQGFVQDIINGTNTPVTVWLSGNPGLEGTVFQELADAGAEILSASQAGIYAGSELYMACGLPDAISRLESDLNQRYLDYSLGRTAYFRYLTVQATGDIHVMEFYEISMYVLFLFLAAIPVSGYLMPLKKAMRQKCSMAGIGAGYRCCARILGMGFLIGAATLPVLLGAVMGKLVEWSWILAGSWLFTCMAASSIVVFLYQFAGTLLGGILLLFLVVTGQHFLAGGFLPLVFLPSSIQEIAKWLPSSILMNTMKMAITINWDWQQIVRCSLLMIGGWCLCTAAEAVRQ